MDIRLASDRNIIRYLIWSKIAGYVDELRGELKRIFLNTNLAPVLEKPPKKDAGYYWNAADFVISHSDEFPMLYPRGGWISLEEVSNIVKKYINPPSFTDPNVPVIKPFPKKQITPQMTAAAIKKLMNKDIFKEWYKITTYSRKTRFDPSIGDIDFTKIITANPKTEKEFHKLINQGIIANKIYEGFKNNWYFLLEKQHKKKEELSPEDLSMMGIDVEEKMAMIKTASIILDMPLFVVNRYLENF